MPRLYLHIGHPKTGSSAIQVSCARSKDTLIEHGIFYPDHRSTSLANTGYFTAGNLTLRHLITEYAEAREIAPNGSDIFFSCEGLFDDLASEDSLVARLARDGVEISILLFLRNPVEYALSLYQQRVKGAGYTGSVDEFLTEFNGLEQTAAVLERIAKLGIPLSLHRFEDAKSRIVQVVEKWLGIPKGVMFQMDTLRVNRSLTRGESVFLRELSMQLGPSGSDHVGRALANNLPNISQELPPLSKCSYDKFVKRIEPNMERLNFSLKSELQYKVTSYSDLFPRETVEGCYVFNQEQIEVIAQALSTRSPGEEFANDFIGWIKLAKKGDVLSGEDIYRLNQLGQILRPGNFPEERMERLRRSAVVKTD